MHSGWSGRFGMPLKPSTHSSSSSRSMIGLGVREKKVSCRWTWLALGHGDGGIVQSGYAFDTPEMKHRLGYNNPDQAHLRELSAAAQEPRRDWVPRRYYMTSLFAAGLSPWPDRQRAHHSVTHLTSGALSAADECRICTGGRVGLRFLTFLRRACEEAGRLGQAQLVR